MARITKFTDGEEVIYETDGGNDASDGTAGGKLSNQVVSEAVLISSVTSLIVDHFINLYQFIHEDNCGTVEDRQSYRVDRRLELELVGAEKLVNLNGAILLFQSEECFFVPPVNVLHVKFLKPIRT